METTTTAAANGHTPTDGPRLRYGSLPHQTLDPVLAERILLDLRRSRPSLFGSLLRAAVLADPSD